MYANINYDAVKAAAKQQTIVDRMDYISLFRTIETYCSKNPDVIIAGQLSLRKIVSDDIDVGDLTSYELFSVNPYQTSADLADAFYDVIGEDGPFDRRTIYVEPTIKWQKYKIWANTRTIVTVYKFGMFNNVKLTDAIGYVSAPGIADDTLKLLYLSPEMQLIYIYTQLYLPKPTAGTKPSLQDLIAYESNIFTNTNIAKRIMGGASNHMQLTTVCDTIWHNLYKYLEDETAPIVVFAPWVSPHDQRQFVQLVGHEHHLEEIKTAVKSRLTATSITFTWRQQALLIPYDPHITYHKLVAKTSTGTTINIAGLYTCLDYHMVPYTKATARADIKSATTTYEVKLGSVWVILKFLIVELYTIRLLMFVGNLERNTFQNRANILLKVVEQWRNIANVALAKPETAAQCFPLTYDGVHIAENVLAKRLVKADRFFVKLYYPHVTERIVDTKPKKKGMR